MSGPVIAIGLDSGDPDVCNRWMEQGHLKNLARLRERGTYVPLVNIPFAAAEAGWTTVFTGVRPERTGFWSQIRLREDYGTDYIFAYDYDEYPLFYALGDDFRVAAIDLPQAGLSKHVNGIQVLGYGAHSPQTPRVSEPKDVLPRLIEKYGDHPTYETDHALLWKRGQLARLPKGLSKGAGLRGRICADFLRQERWDLLLTVFGELHSAGHFLYHISEPDHPFHEPYKNIIGKGRNPLLEVADAVDAAIGEIVAAAPEDATFVIFSQEGMAPNNLDLTSMVFLSELLYRHSFPGQYGLGGGRPGENAAPGPMITKPLSFGWTRATWSTRHDDNKLRSFIRRNLLMEFADIMDRVTDGPTVPHNPNNFHPHWMSPLWYSPEWPKMKAFALPSFSDGYLRINLKGRDKEGIVAPEDYEALCDELTQHIMALKDARTGKPVAAEVIRTRTRDNYDDPKLADADLVVRWTEEPADVVDSPTFGRIGPIPHRRSGGHNEHAFAILAGPGIAAGATLPEAHCLDVPPTILQLMGAPIPDRLDGKPLLPAAAPPRPAAQASETQAAEAELPAS